MTKAEYLERLTKIRKLPWYQQKFDALLSLQIELAEQELAQEKEAAKRPETLSSKK